jgi:hypothetical protein
VQSAHVTLDRNGISDPQPAIDVEYPGSSSAYNYFLRAYNDTNQTAVMFVNGTTRTADGGASTMTIRNDGGPSRFGNASYATTIEGTSVTMPGQPAFYAYKTAYQTSTISGSTIAFTNAVLNRGNDYNTSTSRFTAPVAGVYFFICRLLSPNDGTSLDIRFGVDGVMLHAYSGYGSNAVTGHKQAMLQAPIYLSANQFVEVKFFSGSESAYGSPTYGHSAFMGYLLG